MMSYLFFQNAVIDILHPLTELSSTRWIDCRDSLYIEPYNAQPVLLGDSIYAKGRNGAKGTVWKYYIPTNSWSPLLSPPGVEADNYVLAVYQSQLVWIGGSGHTENQRKKIFVFEQGKGWREDTKLVPSIPDDLPLKWRLSASGDDYYLVVANESNLLVFDGQQWQEKDGPERDMRSILVHNETLYVISQGNGFSICKASMQSLFAGNDSDSNLWKTIKLPYAYEYSSLALVGDHVTILASMGSTSNILCVLGFSCTSDSWIGLT